MASRFYFRQLLAGRDFATTDPIARQMRNFCYLVGDRQAGVALAVDPAYDVDDLLAILEADGMRLGGVLATHYHPDHIGGSMMGMRLAGVVELLERQAVPVHVQRDEAEWVHKVTGLGPGELTLHDPGDVVRVGDVPVTLLHTPGHTPGSQCFLVDGRLVAGDTLFLDGCGRTDLPGGDPADLYRSLRHLASLPDDTILYPGHLYSLASSATLGTTKESNVVFRPTTEADWLRMFS